MMLRIALILIIILLDSSFLFGEDNLSSESTRKVTEMPRQNNLTISSSYSNTQKIIRRHQFESRGLKLAKQGLYEEALSQYRAAQDATLLNYDYEKPIEPVKKIYIRQGKFEQALEIVDNLSKTQKNNDWLLLSHLEIQALIKARDTKNNKPIYDYINYVKTKYPKYFPPNGYFTGMSDIYINDFIHLYDYMHDYDSGIKFMDEVINYHISHPNKNHQSAHKKDVAEYARVKRAWKLDKETGQHGHLQDVIRTSNIISW